MVRPIWWVSQVIPPALLTYFGRTLYLCITEIGPKYLGQRSPALGRLYTIAAATLIPAISILYLRLYFLPASQSVPPRDPPDSIKRGAVPFECLSPAATDVVRMANDELAEPETATLDEPMVNRCWRGKCGGRWKPARARHCSECGVCRAAFDHHCALFANCLTAPYIPTFMALLTLTPPTILLLCLPLYSGLARRAVVAYKLSWSNAEMRTWWYDWPLSWVVSGGPVGRYVTGTVLGWKGLDRIDGGGTFRVEIGALVGVGVVLALITAALGIATAGVIKSGHLTVDRERAKSFARAQVAVDALRKKGWPVPKQVMENLDKLKDRHYFWVPQALDNSDDMNESAEAATSAQATRGRIVEFQETVGPYDRGPQENWRMMMGEGWGWVLPWNALRRGMSRDQIFNWPVRDGALSGARAGLAVT